VGDVTDGLTQEVTVRLSDGRDGDALPELRVQVHDLVLAGACTVVVDVSRARQLSSPVLACLIDAHRRCRSRGGGVVLRGCSSATLDVLRRNGLDRVFRIEGARGRADAPAHRGVA
jgi:anti-anti-sigma factor